MTEEQEKIYTTVKSITLEKGVHNLSNVMKKFEEDDEFPVICNPNFKNEEADVKEYKLPVTPRYYKETWDFANKIGEALNEPKNACKPDGRSCQEVKELITLLRSEVNELEESIMQDEANCFDNTKHSRDELGDVGACCVLILDWINSREEK